MFLLVHYEISSRRVKDAASCKIPAGINGDTNTLMWQEHIPWITGTFSEFHTLTIVESQDGLGWKRP